MRNLSAMDVVKVAKDYFVSSQNALLIPSRDYGSRKFLRVGRSRLPWGLPRSVSLPSGVGSIAGLKAEVSKRPAVQGRSWRKQGAATTMRSGSRKWQHPPEALLNGHILYTVKFLGECAVDVPKGTEVVKDAIRKMKFNKHIKRAEGQKPPKVELLISADAVTILEPKQRTILYQYPLHRISYCADDKSDKRMLTFIAKEANGNQHYCYVFDSEKCAEEITLTIGQAFELAYKRFVETCTTEGDIRKQFLLLQKKVNTLQFENDTLRKRVEDLEKLKDGGQVEEYKRKNEIIDLQNVTIKLRESSTDDDEHVNVKSSGPVTVVGRRLENLVLSSPMTNTKHQTNTGTVGNIITPILSPPPSNTRSNRLSSLRSSSSSAGSTSPKLTSQTNVDPFGMEAFNPRSDPELEDIQAGFSRGLSFGTDDFTLDQLDPLNQKFTKNSLTLTEPQTISENTVPSPLTPIKFVHSRQWTFGSREE
ncbi:PTB domain-containing engulfment adapter protein 1 [Bulinus truncatus]|nr:PTB domain-containing engulfment adapter protein 1 [Bulinus truncatus]